MTDFSLSRAGQDAAHEQMWRDSGPMVFKCPTCGGVVISRGYRMCSGLASDRHDPKRMKTADPAEGADGDTPGLVTS